MVNDVARTSREVVARHQAFLNLVSGWFDDVTASRLLGAGITTLGDLNAKVSNGGRWYTALPSVGHAKATCIATHLATLLAREPSVFKPVFALVATPSLFSATQGQGMPASPALPSSTPSTPSSTLLHAKGDLEAVDAWIGARAGASLTAKSYRREAHRLLLWLQYERRGKTLAHMDVSDCGDYMAFLENIPPQWISRVRAAPGKPGWAPFRGPLGHDSQRLAIVIVASLFGWLQAAQYLASNPWPLLSQNTGDDPERRVLDSKALSEAAFGEVLRFIQGQAPSPSRSRIRFILRFVEAVGLRSAELLNAPCSSSPRAGSCRFTARAPKTGLPRFLARHSTPFKTICMRAAWAASR